MSLMTDDQPEIRIADADREAVAEQLRTAATDGRLELTELDARVGAAYTAKTASELEAITADLPSLVHDDRPLRFETKSGSRQKTGHWVVPSQIITDTTSGSVRLDFTEAECVHPEITVQATATSGSLLLIVPKGWGVNLDDVTVASGSVKNKVVERPAPGRPLITVHGSVRSGMFKARYPRRSFWDWLFRRHP